MSITDNFRAAWSFEASWHGTDLLPTALTRAAVSALSIDTVGLSLVADYQHIPIAASSPHAAAAEQWQFTIGDGPSCTAYDTSEPVVADEDEMRRRWPALHDQLHQHTPVRSVVALPLGLGPGRIGVLELYAYTPRPAAGFDLLATQVVASLIYTALLGAARTDRLDAEVEATRTSDFKVDRAAADPAWTDPAWTDLAGPAWMSTAPVRRRENVWIAVGMISHLLSTSALDALTVLRARAYTAGQTLDDLANDLITGRIRAFELTNS